MRSAVPRTTTRLYMRMMIRVVWLVCLVAHSAELAYYLLVGDFAAKD